MKKILAALLTAATITAFATTATLAYPDAYPASTKSDGMPAASGTLLPGEVIGNVGGWGDNEEVGRAAAFDGDWFTFFDPTGANNGSYCGVKVPEKYVLTEVRILPRDGQLTRFNGAQIWGFEEDWGDDEFDTSKATLIWDNPAEDEDADDPLTVTEQGWQIIKADQFIAGANVGFTHYAYYSEGTHGDVAEVELYGTTLANETAPTSKDEPAPAVVETPAATVEPVVISAPVQTTTAPITGDAGILFAVVALGATAFTTIKLTNSKNKT